MLYIYIHISTGQPVPNKLEMFNYQKTWLFFILVFKDIFIIMIIHLFLIKTMKFFKNYLIV